MQHFNASMLTLARESRELTQVELSALSGVPQAVISKLEAGVSKPSTSQVEALSTALKYPQSLFSRSDQIYGFNASVFFHRKRTDMPVKTLRRLHAVLNLTRMRLGSLLRSAEVEARFPLKRFSLDEGDSPEDIARKVRALLHIPMGPIKDLTHVLEDAGVVVVPYRFDTRRTDAISEWIEGQPPIVLLNTDESITADRMRWTLAHELAHLVMHKHPTDDMEEEANRFASEFLLPEREIKQQLRNVKIANLALLKAVWRVSMSALLERAKQLKTITPTQYRYMRVNFSKLKYNMREPEHTDIEPEAPSLQKEMVNIHIQKLGYSLEELARLVDLYTDECVDLFGLPRSFGLRLVSGGF